MEIFPKHISNKIITCNDRDAPYITSKLKTVIKRNARAYMKWVKMGRNQNDHVREVENITNKLIRDAKYLHVLNIHQKA